MSKQLIESIFSTRLVLMGSILLLFTFFSPYHPKLNNPNEGVRIYMVKAMVDHGTFQINDVVKKWGYIDDKSKKGNKLYSSKAPFMSMMGAAAYGVYRIFGQALNEKDLTQLCRFWANALPAFLLLLLLGWYLQRYFQDRALTDFILIALMTSTHLLAYVHIFSGHTVAALCTGILMLTLLHRPKPRQLFFQGMVVGACATLAVGAEYPAFLAVVPLSLGFLFHQRMNFIKAFFGCVVGALPFALVSGYAHHHMFGQFWKTGYSFLENKGYHKLHSQDFFGIGAPKLDILNSVLWSTDVGLVFFTPLVILGFWGLARWWRNSEQRLNALFISISLLGMFLFITGHRGWRGGWVVGPRYISEVSALLVILAGALLHEKKAFIRINSIWLSTALILCVLGIIHSGIAGAFFPHLSETYKNPVYEMMLPMALQGFSPDTWALDLGAPPKVSAYLGLCLLFLPLLVWNHLYRKVVSPLSVVLIAATISFACLIGPMLPGSHAGTIGIETRHLYRNWSPAHGHPLALPPLKESDIQIQTAMEPTSKTFRKINQMCRQSGERK
jgi:hypothetical protein